MSENEYRINEYSNACASISEVLLFLKRRVSMQYFLKLLGSSDVPITPIQKFDKPEQPVHFATKSLPKVSTNDILICYGVGIKMLCAAYKIATPPSLTTIESVEFLGNDKGYISVSEFILRYPHYVMTKNIAPKFGFKWKARNLLFKNIIDVYENKYGALDIKVWGSVCFGKSYFKIPRDFAEYLLEFILKDEEDKEFSVK